MVKLEMIAHRDFTRKKEAKEQKKGKEPKDENTSQ